MITALKQKKSDFLKQIKLTESIDFPSIAILVKSDWFKELKPEVEKDPAFKKELEQILEGYRYSMLQKVFNIALNGKTAGYGKNPELSHVREVVKLIDSGIILGKVESESEGGSSQDNSLMDMITAHGVQDAD